MNRIFIAAQCALITVLIAALLLAAFAPAIAAVERNYIHQDCRNDPAC